MKANPVDTIPSYDANSESWVDWHKVLKSNFGKKVANSLWIKAWGIRGSSKSSSNTLREYLKDEGITIDSSFGASIVDFGASIGDWIANAFTVAKWVGISLLVIMVGGIGMIVFNIARKPAESIGKATRAFVTKGA